ncbi:hypothetical protein BH23ACT8_BH23ACT8_08790 [soil metagenome]
MDQQTLYILIGVAAVVVIVLVALAVMASKRRRRERDELRARYGSEYDRTVRAAGGERAAAADLHEREREREALSLRSARDDERDEIRARMAALQYRFVDDPHQVLLETQRVAVDALRVRGYPVVDDREKGLRALSVDHPEDSGPIRELLEGSYGRDVGKLRELFIAARHAMATVVELSYSMRDAARALDEADTAGPASTPVAADASTSALDTRVEERPAAAATEPLARPAAEPEAEPEPEPGAEAGAEAEPEAEPEAGADAEADRQRPPERAHTEPTGDPAVSPPAPSPTGATVAPPPVEPGSSTTPPPAFEPRTERTTNSDPATDVPPPPPPPAERDRG